MKMISGFLIILLVCAIQCQMSEFSQKNCSAYGLSGDSAFSIDFCKVPIIVLIKNVALFNMKIL